MAKQRVTVGSLLQIDLGADLFAYAQVVSKSEIAFFDYFGPKLPQELVKSALAKQVLFVVSVMNSAIKTGRWLVVGSGAVSDALRVSRKYFMQDKISKGVSLYDSHTGEISPANITDISDLECAAVWEAEHIEDRLRDHRVGNENIWVNQLKPV